jgi:hypothetical protein
MPASKEARTLWRASLMSKALYVVIFSRETWWVDFEGKAHGPFPSLEEATEEGRQLARFMAHSGRASEVLIPDDRGRYHVAWDSANEPHAGSDYQPTAA